jgi:pimeloyl-ACP methyl ester carboxylesterase
MSHNARSLVAIIVIGVVVVGTVVLWRWLSKPPTVEVTGPDVPGAVILIPGYGGNAGALTGLAGQLQAAGRQVVVADIGDGRADIAQYGSQVAATASGLVRDGSPSVDLVGYSMGGLVARSAAEKNPAAIRRVATIASPHQGTAIAGLGAFLNDPNSCPTACQQMAPSSDFLGALPVAADADRWLSVWSEGDDTIQPPESSDLDGATNINVTADCGAGEPDHGGIIRTPTVWTLVADFLATGEVTAACR